MRPYRASNRAPFGGLIVLLIISIVAGAAVGGLMWAIEHFTSFYLVLVFPLLAGLIAGGVLSVSVRSGKVRSPALAWVFGLVAAVVMFGVYHFATYYVSFRGEIRDIINEQGGQGISDEELDFLIDAQLEEDTGDAGFVGFMKLMAEDGFSITRATASSSSGGIEIKGTAAWIYWGVELLIAGVTAAVVAGRQAGSPFDEETGQWYGPVMIVARAPGRARRELVEALKAGDYEAAGKLLTPQAVKGNALEVGVRRSPDTASQEIFLVVQQRQGNNASVIQRGMVSPGELQRLTRAIEAAATPQNVVM